MRKIKSDFEEAEVWMRLIENLREYNDEYRADTGYQLLAEYDAQLHTKPWDSFFLKTYRKNVLDNKSWPDAPQDGWILPDNWFSKINDTLRTLLIVKYLDGADFMVNKIKPHFENHGAICRASFEARAEGYYAAHLHARQRFEVPKLDWDTQQIDVWVEVQITTQLQEVIRRLTHRFYEQRRVIEERDTNWQWNYRSDEFSANYLGHILHFVEGMILEVRDKERKRT